jgi:hypothetical protein
MAEPVHVLVYGSSGASVCDFYRLGMYRERLAKLGVVMRDWSDFDDHTIKVPAEYANRLADAVCDGVAQIDRAPIDWADVILFRRWYSVAPCCEDCDTTGSEEFVAEHCRATGHRPNTPDRLMPLLLRTFTDHPEALRGRGIVYETDDDLLAGRPWLPYYNRIQPDRVAIEGMLRRADLVTVSTPVLAKMAARFKDEVRVVRNAVDPAWYELEDAAPNARADSTPEPELPGDPRIAYYGSSARLRDYQVCRDVVDEVAAATPGSRRVWLGAEQDPRVAAIVDEVHPYVEGVRNFARALAGLHADIGLAPVVGDDFDRAHSELHWLEYTLAGAATIASRTMGGGPYDVIRDGVDGLLARNKAEWRDGLRRLARSRDLRAELQGRARERVLADYTADVRAHEWADAYRWAAEHGGRGALPRLHVVGGKGDPNVGPAAKAQEMSAHSRVQLEHRQRVRREARQAIDRIAAARGDRDVCWPEGAEENPLVSIVIPTYNKGRIIAERPIASVLAQTYQNWELVIVGDCATPETVEAVRSFKDPRIRFENLTARSPRPDDPELAWMMSGSRPFNRGLELARGQWICPLADDDEFTPDHIELLLPTAIENRVEFLYAQSWMEDYDGSWFRIGEWPPRQGGLAAGSMIYSAALKFMTLDDECWREREPNDWNLWRRMWDAGVRMGFLPRVVFRHYAEARHRAAYRPAAGGQS